MLAARPIPSSGHLSAFVYHAYTPRWTVRPWLTTTTKHPELLFNYDLRPSGTSYDPAKVSTVQSALTSWFQKRAPSAPVAVGQYVLATFLPTGWSTARAAVPGGWYGAGRVDAGRVEGGVPGRGVEGGLGLQGWNEGQGALDTEPSFAHQHHITADQATLVAAQLRQAKGLTAVEVVEAPLNPRDDRGEYRYAQQGRAHVYRKQFQPMVTKLRAEPDRDRKVAHLQQFANEVLAKLGLDPVPLRHGTQTVAEATF